MFWIICIAMAAVVAISISVPLIRRRTAGEEPAAAYDLRIYRDQLREVERDLERGLVEPSEAERLRNEIGRKVLAADRALSREETDRRSPGGPAAIAVLVVLLAGAGLIYHRIGAPQMPDEPLARRIELADAFYAGRPSQAEAEKIAPKPQRPPADPEYLSLIEQLRTTVARTPDDQRGLELLALHEERLGNLVAARQAQARLVTLRGDKASADDHLRLAALSAEAAGGLITADAEAELARALELRPLDPQGRYMVGLIQIQNGRPDRAFPIWAALLDEGHGDEPWAAALRVAIGDLAWFAGRPDYTPPDAAPARGPDAAAMAAAQDMSPEARQQMIEGMVKGLEARLGTEGGTPEEWARLISALAVLGQTDHAQDILDEARTHFAASPAGMEKVETAGKQAGLK